MVSYTLTRQTDSLLIKATDERFNCYKVAIGARDPFVVNFCQGNLDMLLQLLQDNASSIVVEEHDNDVTFLLSKPIVLKYVLRKEKLDGGDHGAMILGKISELVERLDVMDKRTQDLEEQLQYGVIIPGYAMGVVPVDTKELYMTFGKWLFRGTSQFVRNVTGGYVESAERASNRNIVCNYNFEGTTLTPIKYLKNLKIFTFGVRNASNATISRSDECPVSSEEFDVLANCKKLKSITIVGTNIADMSWSSELKDLETICLSDSPNLTDIRPLLECPNLKSVDVTNCPGIHSIPNFPSSVTVTK